MFAGDAERSRRNEGGGHVDIYESDDTRVDSLI